MHLEAQGLCLRYKNLCDSSGEVVINLLGNFIDLSKCKRECTWRLKVYVGGIRVCVI